MNIRHVALVCRSEERADQFFGNLLGLKKSEPKILSLALSEAIFQVSSELKMVSYSNDHVYFEIFIDRQAQSKGRPIEHVCLEVQDLPAFLQKCHRLNVEILQIPKDDYLLYFIRDFDNNLFELKEKKSLASPFG
jgi:catechol 2,3-dioxygenase-like lactoylglutathione lyase family enzyme